MALLVCSFLIERPTMKTLLAIVFLLAWVTPGGAEDSRLHFGPGELIDGNCVIGALVEFNDGSVYQCQNNRTWERLLDLAGTPRIVMAGDCETMMEQAMREAEPYIFSWSIRLQRDGSLTIQDV